MTIRDMLLAGTIIPALVGSTLGEATPLGGMQRLQLAQAAQEPTEKQRPAAPAQAPAQQRPAPPSPKAEPRPAPETPRAAAPAPRAQPPAERAAPQAPKVAPQAPRAAAPSPAAEPARPAAAFAPEKPIPQTKPEPVRPNAAKPIAPAPAARVVAPEAPRPAAPAAPAPKAPTAAPAAQAPKPASAQPVPTTPTAAPRPSPAPNEGAGNPAVRAVAPAAAPPQGSTSAQPPVQRSAAPSAVPPVPHAQPQPANAPAASSGNTVGTAPNGVVAPAQPAPGQPTAGQSPVGQPVAGRPVPAAPTPGSPAAPAARPAPPVVGGSAQPAGVAPSAPVPPGQTRPTTPGQPAPAVAQPNGTPIAPPASGQAQPAALSHQQPGTAAAPASPGQVQGQRRDGGSGAGVAAGAAAGLVGGFLAAQGLQHLDEVRSRRQEFDEDGVAYVREPGRTIVRENDRYFVAHDENERFRDLGYDLRTERRGADNVTIYDRPGGVQVLTYTTDDGRLIRRVRRFPDGRQIVLIDNGPDGPPRRYDQDVVDLPPPPLDIPQDRYIVDADRADEPLLYDTLAAPPVERIARRYTLDEVRYSPTLRARMRSVDLNTINFETGSWTITPDQAGHLKAIAQAIGQAIGRNPQEIFLIEGYTDAVGQDVDNLSLSDRRAQAVAAILTTSFQIPPENLTTQGYGAQNLKEPTRGPSAINRRVTIRRITPLIAGENAPR